MSRTGLVKLNTSNESKTVFNDRTDHINLPNYMERFIFQKQVQGAAARTLSNYRTYFNEFLNQFYHIKSLSVIYLSISLIKQVKRLQLLIYLTNI